MPPLARDRYLHAVAAAVAVYVAATLAGHAGPFWVRAAAVVAQPLAVTAVVWAAFTARLEVRQLRRVDAASPTGRHAR